jgi:hypothetical protein
MANHPTDSLTDFNCRMLEILGFKDMPVYELTIKLTPINPMEVTAKIRLSNGQEEKIIKLFKERVCPE